MRWTPKFVTLSPAERHRTVASMTSRVTPLRRVRPLGTLRVGTRKFYRVVQINGHSVSLSIGLASMFPTPAGNPLATSEQHDGEALAMRALASPVVEQARE